MKTTTLQTRLLPLLIAAVFPRSGLALELDKDAHAKLTDVQRALYVEKDGKFRLDVDGMPDTTALHNALKEERENVKKAKDEARRLAETYKDIDPKKYREMMDAIDSGDDAALIKAGRTDEVVAKKTEKLRKALEAERDAEKERATKAEERAKKYEQKVLDNHVRAAAAKAGLHPPAIEDALMYARTQFSLNEDGEAVQLGTDGKPVPGKDGKTPFGPGEWLESMKTEKQHWFPAGSTGAGAKGDGGAGGAGGKTIKRADFDKLPPAERANTVKEKVAVVD